MTQFQNQALRNGFHIGVYEIKGILSASRFAITYRGWNHHLNAKVVLKEYFPRDFAVRGEEGRMVAPKSERDRAIYEYGLASFVEQAGILGQIQQRSVVGVHNALEINGTAYLIMDYEDAVPLSSLSEPSASLAGPELKVILTSLLAGLEQVHAHGTVHGDIHPSNILLRENGEAMLIDFAATRLAIAEHSNTLAQELRAGYAAFERYEPGSRPSPESDLYALGATMVRCITHTEPAPAPERISALSKGEADPLEPLLGSGAPIDNEGLLKTIDWMLRPHAKDRPRSATEVLAALSAEDEDVQQFGTETKPGSDKGDMAKPVASFPRTALWVGGMIGVAALTASGLWYLQSTEPAPDTLAFKPDSRMAAASKTKESDAARGIVPLAHPDVPVAESPGKINTEPLRGSAWREAPEAEQAPAETSETPPPEAVAEARPSPQPPVASEHPDTGAPAVAAEPITGVRAAGPAKKPIETPQPPSEIVAAQRGEHTTTKLVAGGGTIQSHLATAEEAIASLRLTTPAGNNAHRHYQAVLAVDPANVEARAGLQRIVDSYVLLIKKALVKQRLKRAAVYLARAEAVLPNAPSLQRMRAQLYDSREYRNDAADESDHFVPRPQLPPPADRLASNNSPSASGTPDGHVVSAATDLQAFLRDSRAGLYETDKNFEVEFADWNRDGVKDLVAIQKRGAGSGTTEVLALSGVTNFQTFLLRTGTALHETDENFEFEFADWDRDGVKDLVAIQKRGTGNGTIEVFILAGATNFQTFLLRTGTALNETDENFQFAFTDSDGDGVKDLVAMKKTGSGSGTSEVFVLSGATNFQTFLAASQ